ncbi:MAG TPA: GntR family transcriptional regulator [Trueperaceae bacterium]|nr:GntR family transcriptional regulator [Trueperaceae bacterium]
MSTVHPGRSTFERPATVAEDVYEYLRGELLAGRLAAGAWLREQEVATALHVSRTPVREAVRRLAQDGLLVVEANRGVKVHEPDLTEARATYQVRGLLEGMAAGLAAERSTPDARERLEAQLRAMSEAARDDAVRHIEADNAFHALVAELSGNRVLLEHIERLNVRITRIKIITRHLNPTGFAREQHAAIAGAILSGDAVAARQRMESHVQANLEFIERKLQQSGSQERADVPVSGELERSTT